MSTLGTLVDALARRASKAALDLAEGVVSVARRPMSDLPKGADPARFSAEQGVSKDFERARMIRDAARTLARTAKDLDLVADEVERGGWH